MAYYTKKDLLKDLEKFSDDAVIFPLAISDREGYEDCDLFEITDDNGDIWTIDTTVEGETTLSI